MIVVAATCRPIKAEFDWFARLWNPPQLRSTIDFVRDELVIPEGKHKGEHFREHVQPWAGLLLREMDNPQWYSFAICGCVQSGKTLIGFVVPVLKYLFDNVETVIIGVPTVDEIGRDKWTDEVLPAIRSSGYGGLLPTKGPGSKGGFPKEVHFVHGARLKIMGGTGGDEKRSSYTARVVVITELDKMDTAGEVSREADPVTQMIARTMGRDIADRRVFMECTVSHAKGRIWQEYTKGSASRIACQCPYCREYITPERDSLKGWQDAENELEAEENAHFECPGCDHALMPTDRQKMNEKAVLVHKGQEIDSEGVVSGEMPQTRTLGFRWNAWNNLFWSAGAIGVTEWRARRAANRESAERETSQFYWTVPWDPPDIDMTPLDAETLAKRTATYKQGIVPLDCIGISVGVDTGKRQLDWTGIAWLANGCGFVIDYGKQIVEPDKYGVKHSLGIALTELQKYLDSGWHSADGMIIRPSQVWIDSGWHEHTKPVYQFCLEAGKECVRGSERYRPSKGYGEGQQRMTQYTAPKKTTSEIRHIGKEFHMSWLTAAGLCIVHVNADHWKSELHTRLAMDASEAGAIVLYETPDMSGHDDFIDELLAEEQREKYIEEKGTVIVFVRLRRKNHKLDSTYAAVAAGDFLLTFHGLAKKRPEKSKPFLTPHGEPYLISDRKDS